MIASFKMYGVRQVLERIDNPHFLKSQVDTLEDAINNDKSELAIDLSRAIIETICQTILKDRGIEIRKEWLNKTPDLFKATLDCLELISDQKSEKSKFDLGLETTLKGLQDTVLGICQIRNSSGMASHGKDAFKQPLDLIHAIFTAQAADNLIAFLYASHKSSAFDYTTGRIYYDDHKDFNEYLDNLYEAFTLGNIQYSSSQILFYVDEIAYREQLLEYKEIQKIESLQVQQESANSEGIESPILESTSETEAFGETFHQDIAPLPDTDLTIPAEIAFFEILSQAFTDAIDLEQYQLELVASELYKKLLANSIADWAVDTTSKAKMRILIKRILRIYGLATGLSDDIPDLILQKAEEIVSNDSQ